MTSTSLLHKHLGEYCPEIHKTRLQSVMDVATGLQRSKNISLTAIGRQLDGEMDIKHKIKKVDRLVGNHHLYGELGSIYGGLSSYLFKYLLQDKQVPLIVDLCYLKDTHDIQMLSAEIASQGRSLPIYREVFSKGELQGRGKSFIKKLSGLIPSTKTIVVVMDAGFGNDWFQAIASVGWYWLVRARRSKHIKLSDKSAWQDAGELFSAASTRAKHYPNAFITKQSPLACRVVLKQGSRTNTRKKPTKLPRNYHSANGNYQRQAKEPWILATNLPKQYTTAQIVNYYKKRMQIEESFRDVKSHQYGLSARYLQTRCIYRWGIQMMLAAIVQITLWLIGVISHSEGYQRRFQANTVRDKKVFSYFYLGQLMVEHNMLNELNFNDKNLMTKISDELEKKW